MIESNGIESTGVHTPKDVARILKFSLSTVYKLFRENKIRTVPDCPLKRVADAELKRYINSGA